MQIENRFYWEAKGCYEAFQYNGLVNLFNRLRCSGIKGRGYAYGL